LARWAKRLSWTAVAQSFHTSWTHVYRSVAMAATEMAASAVHPAATANVLALSACSLVEAGLMAVVPVRS